MCVCVSMILMFLTALWSYKLHLEFPVHFWFPFSSQAPAFVLSLLGTDLVSIGYYSTSFGLQLIWYSPFCNPPASTSWVLGSQGCGDWFRDLMRFFTNIKHSYTQIQIPVTKLLLAWGWPRFPTRPPLWLSRLVVLHDISQNYAEQNSRTCQLRLRCWILCVYLCVFLSSRQSCHSKTNKSKVFRSGEALQIYNEART